MIEQTIQVLLNDDDAKSFVSFQKHRGLIKLLEQVGFFSLVNGKCEINVDENGRLGDIYIHKRYNTHTNLRV